MKLLHTTLLPKASDGWPRVFRNRGNIAVDDASMMKG